LHLQSSQEVKPSSLSKSYADLRVKLGQPKDDCVSIPSQITQDEWAEIAIYQQELDQQRKRKEQDDYKKKKQHIKEILDK
jgi:hypothetical protein